MKPDKEGGMSEWQPIETAPKDGTQILVWDGANAQVAEFYVRADGSSSWELGHRWVNGHTRESWSCSGVLTHWMPLPARPSDKGE
jgi:hypothetical protein